MEKNGTEPHCLSFFAICNNVAHSLEPGEAPDNSAFHKAPNYVQRS